MKHLRLKADPWNEWIYDPSHRDYNSPQAEHMRRSRASAIANAPLWILYDAFGNELAIRDREKK